MSNMTSNPKEAILAHCEMLHDCAAGLDGVLVVSTFYANPLGDSDRPGQVTHHPIGDAERMADTISDQLSTPHANVYVGLQVMRRGLARGKRGAESDIVAVLGLVADMDADTGKVGGLPLPASYSVETSPGNEQPVWLFDRPLSVAEAKPLAQALRRATGSDAGTGDVSHTWRIPGTLNWPNKKKIERGRAPEPADVSVKKEWDGSLVSVEEFAAAVAAHASTAPAIQATLGDIPSSVETTPDLQAMLASDGQPDRSAHAARVVESIAFAGHSLEEAVSLVVNCAGAWADRYADADARQKDVERLWSKFGGGHSEDAARGKEIAEALLAGYVQTREPIVRPPEEAAPLIKATPFEWKDPKKLPRREYINGTHLIRKYVSATVAPGGLGKSSLTIAEGISMCVGKPLFGGGLEPKRRVWLWNGEDDREELDRRIMAACLHYKISAEQLAGHLFVDTGREAEIVVAIEERSGVKIVRPVVDAVIKTIKANRIDVMIVDPFVAIHAVNENDNGAIDKVAKLWAKIADECNMAIDLVHHVRKVSDREVTVDDARGAGALLAATRSARVLNRMTPEQAQKANISEDDRMQYFSIQNGKANLAPMSSRLTWRRLQSVALNNHVSITEPGDHAPVVVPWEWPSAQEAVREVAPDDLRLVKARVSARECRKDPQSKDWAGHAVAEALGLDAATDKAGIRRMIDGWLDAGDLVVSKRKDSKGQMREFVDVAD